MQRDARNFTSPLTFWPDRWLIADGLAPAPAPSGSGAGQQQQFTHNADAFIPFSYGAANCVGKNLALLEMRMVICLCMQKFEMRFAQGWDAKRWEDNLEDTFVASMGPLPVVLHRRD